MTLYIYVVFFKLLTFFFQRNLVSSSHDFLSLPLPLNQSYTVYCLENWTLFIFLQWSSHTFVFNPYCSLLLPWSFLVLSCTLLKYFSHSIQLTFIFSWHIQLLFHMTMDQSMLLYSAMFASFKKHHILFTNIPSAFAQLKMSPCFFFTLNKFSIKKYKFMLLHFFISKCSFHFPCQTQPPRYIIF